MGDNTELEDGEIKELSDSEYEDFIKTDSVPHHAPLRNNTTYFHRTPKFTSKRRQHSYESWRAPKEKYKRKIGHNLNEKSRKQHKRLSPLTVSAKENVKCEEYDLDDYELLLARHELIRQQLDRVNENAARSLGLNSPKTTKLQNVTSETSKHENNNFKKQNELTRDVIMLSDHSNQETEDDEELMQLRRVLLSQTLKKDTTHKEINNIVEGSDRSSNYTVSNATKSPENSVLSEKTDDCLSVLDNTSETDSRNQVLQENNKHISKNNAIKPVSAGVEESTKYFSQSTDIDVINIIDDSDEDCTIVVDQNVSTDKATLNTNHVSSNTLELKTIATNDEQTELTPKQELDSTTSPSHSNKVDDFFNGLCLETSHKQTSKLSRNQRRKGFKRIKKDVNTTNSGRVITRAQAAKTSTHTIVLKKEEPFPFDKITKRKKKRGGKRNRYLAYRAQQKKELEIFQRQQEEVALDNYNNIPMEIEEEDSIEGFAPLPLIETTQVRPPPPPGDGFQPQLDPTTLSMTSSNVAWIPGYMESLDETIDTTQPSLRLVVESEEPLALLEENKNDSKTEEKEVWALRAQALKSLACKRAVKAKNKKKQLPLTDDILPTPVTSLSSVPASVIPTIQTDSVSLPSDITSFASITVSSPTVNALSPTVNTSSPTVNTSSPTVNTSSPTVNASSPIKTKLIPMPVPTVKSAEVFAKYIIPKHAPVVIELTKDDFHSDSSESDDSDCSQEIQVDRFLREAKKHEIKRIVKRRKSGGDENLLKDLHNCIDRSSTKIKKCSTYIVKDQLSYKKLQAQILQKKALFDKQSQGVKCLQEKLNTAIKIKIETKKAHNNLYGQIKDVKDKLKEKLALRNNVDEDILRARSILSLQSNEKGVVNKNMKLSILTLMKSLQGYQNKIVEMEKTHEKHQHVVVNKPKETSSSLKIKSKEPIIQMNKNDLEKLEKQLHEKLKTYHNKRKSLNVKHSKENSSQEDGNMKLSMSYLPNIKSMNQLKKLQLKLSSTSEQNKCAINCSLLEMLQSSKRLMSTEKFKTTVQTVCSPQQHCNILQGLDVLNEEYLKEDSYTKYRSVLCCFKSYRLSPYFRTQSKFSIKSATFSNCIEAKDVLCKFDVSGSCNDENCSFWHFNEKCNLSADAISRDLVAYDLRTFNATEDMSDVAKRQLLDVFYEQFKNQYGGIMSSDEKLLLLWNNLKESRRSRKQLTYESVNFHPRDWFVFNKSVSSNSTDINVEYYLKQHNSLYFLKKKKKRLEKKTDLEDGCFESQEVRYFSESYNPVSILEKALEENPSDVKLWISLAKQKMKQDVDSENKSSNTEHALSVLSEGLEKNRDSEELWIDYLTLFSTNSTAAELRELCYQAVMYAATYNVWWTCLNLETTHLGKQEICTEMIKFILESEESTENKSHYLLEILLYATQLLTFRGKFATAISYLSSALGGDEFISDVEKLQVGNISNLLNISDVSLLWLCYMSLQVFYCLPNYLFQEDVGPGRVISKMKFLLEWNSKKWNIDEAKIRKLFKEAIYSPNKLTLSMMKSKIILFENLIAFEISMNNIKEAVDSLQSLVDDEPSFIDIWVLLLNVYIQHAPMDAVVKIAEEAIHKCEHDVEIVYYYTSWLFKEGMPSLALEILTKCIHVYFQFDEKETNIPDVLHLYQKVLGLPVPYSIGLPTYLPGLKTSHLMFYYWLNYCLVLRIKKIPPLVMTTNTATDEAFESAVHQYTSRENTKKLWIAYLEYRIEYLKKTKTIITKDKQEFIDLLYRSLVSVPAVTHSRNIHWKDYKFHNQVLDLCLSSIPYEEHSEIFMKAINLMSDNISLAIRVCQHELENGNYQQARVICGSLLHDFPKCLSLWHMAIQVELRCNCIREVRWLYQEAVQSLHYYSSLWKDYALFEIKHSENPENLNDTLQGIINEADGHGVDLREVVANLKP